MEGLVLDFVCLGQGYYLDVFVDFLDDLFGVYVVQAFVLFSFSICLTSGLKSSFLLFSCFLLTHFLELFRRFSLSFSSICLRLVSQASGLRYSAVSRRIRYLSLCVVLESHFVVLHNL